jgi:hypothetical protein
LRAILAVHPHLGHHGVRADLQIAGLQGRGQGDGDGIEHGSDIAAVHAIAAVMAGRAIVMHAGQLRQAPMGRPPAEVFGGSREDGFGAVERHHRQKHAVRKLRYALHGAADSNEALHAIVVGLHVGVIDGPIHAIAIAGSGFEFVVGHAVGSSGPVQGTSSQTAGSSPAIDGAGSGGIWILLAIQHDAVIALAAGVTAQQARFAAAAVIHLIKKCVVEILGGIHAAAGLQHQDFHARFCQFHGRPAAAGAGADHDHIIGFCHTIFRARACDAPDGYRRGSSGCTNCPYIRAPQSCRRARCRTRMCSSV